MSSDSATTTTETETNRSIHHTDLDRDPDRPAGRDGTAGDLAGERPRPRDQGRASRGHPRRGGQPRPPVPELDKLAEMGIVEKEAQSIDARTNSYRVTVEGFRLLDARFEIHIEGALAPGA